MGSIVAIVLSTDAAASAADVVAVISKPMDTRTRLQLEP